MKRNGIVFLLLLLINVVGFCQSFKVIPPDLISGTSPFQIRQILPTTKSTVLFANTTPGLMEMDKMQFHMNISQGISDKDGRAFKISKLNGAMYDLFYLQTGIKLIAEGPGGVVYFVTDSNHIGVINYNVSYQAMVFPPFNFNVDVNQGIEIHKIWLDLAGDLYIGTSTDTLYIIGDAAGIFKKNKNNEYVTTYAAELNKDSVLVIKDGKNIKKVILGNGIHAHSFATEPGDNNTIWIGTNHGLYKYDRTTGRSMPVFSLLPEANLTITQMEIRAYGSQIWFSTLEKGMASYNQLSGSVVYYTEKLEKSEWPILSFCRKSATEFFVAPADTLPAIFNTEFKTYRYLNDTIFHHSKNTTTDIRTNAAGSLFMIKGGLLYWSMDAMANPLFSDIKIDTAAYKPVLINDVLINNISYSNLRNTYVDYENTSVIRLKHYENNLSFIFIPRGFLQSDQLIFSWKLEGYNEDWTTLPYAFSDEKMNMASFVNLDPGEYRFVVRIKKAGEEWKQKMAALSIVIQSPFWKSWLFWISILSFISLLVYGIVSLRVKSVRREERKTAQHEKELLEMEARALRAQMNPHFIFNCMNSIKALILNDEKQKSMEYLTTFSKLIRMVFQNSDKRNISLYDELETCRLYTRLEAMRLEEKLDWSFEINPELDLKSVMVPALIIQPFIENAIWHGIVPKNGGRLKIRVKGGKDKIICEVEDDGIGRVLSKQNKPNTPVIHESKGVHLSQSRINLEKVLNSTNAEIIIEDLYEEKLATGTRVLITFNLN